MFPGAAEWIFEQSAKNADHARMVVELRAIRMQQRDLLLHRLLPFAVRGGARLSHRLHDSCRPCERGAWFGWDRRHNRRRYDRLSHRPGTRLEVSTRLVPASPRDLPRWRSPRAASAPSGASASATLRRTYSCYAIGRARGIGADNSASCPQLAVVFARLREGLPRCVP